MKKLTKTFGVFAILASFAYISCSSPKTTQLSDSPVAIVEQVGNDKIITADIHAFKDTVDILLSSIAGKLEIIPLESKIEAFFKYGTLSISDNYIGIRTNEPASFKLFDRKGNYLRDIGMRGNGPGEYRNIYSATIDEKNGKIYILPWQTSTLLVFGLDGTRYPSIPFPIGEEGMQYYAPKGIFRVNEDATVTVAVLPVVGTASYVWTQDIQGNLIKSIGVPASIEYVDYSSEIAAGNNTGDFDPFWMIYGNKSNDPLYKYSLSENRMIPIFTVKNIQDMEPPYYSYSQIPGYFIGERIPGMVRNEYGWYSALRPKYFIVDKNTLHGAYYKLKIDELGGIDVDPYFSEGYFIMNSSAIGFKEKLQKLLDGRDIKDSAMRKKIEELNNSIDEEDNNIVILGKLKD